MGEEVSESVHPKRNGRFGMTAENGENTGRTGRNRRGYRQWTEEQKWQIVAETDKPGMSVSVVARRHDVNANQLFSWRRQYQRGEFGNGKTGAALVPVGVIGEGGIVSAISDLTKPKPDVSPVPQPELQPSTASLSKQSKMIEVELRSGTRIRIDADVKGSALHQVLKLIRSLA